MSVNNKVGLLYPPFHSIPFPSKPTKEVNTKNCQKPHRSPHRFMPLSASIINLLLFLSFLRIENLLSTLFLTLKPTNDNSKTNILLPFSPTASLFERDCVVERRTERGNEGNASLLLTFACTYAHPSPKLRALFSVNFPPRKSKRKSKRRRTRYHRYRCRKTRKVYSRS